MVYDRLQDGIKAKILKITPKPAVPPGEHNRAILEIEIFTDCSAFKWEKEDVSDYLKSYGIFEDFSFRIKM